MEDRSERKRWRKGPLLAASLFLLAGAMALAVGVGLSMYFAPEEQVRMLAELEVPSYVDVQIIGIDGDSRRGVKLEGMEDVVIHYVGNPGTTAQQNHDWYENPASEVSSHFLIGLNGEVIQCVPLDEKSSATNHRNADTISIEVCHPDETGAFNEETYATLVELTAWLVKSCSLDTDHIIRHYDVTGKDCPRYFVQNEAAWAQFKADVAAEMENIE
ncbi:MAG: N-acetylmuramoyl-L-alanine amidase [Oscillospiraceae bacterium]|nr:N-acetylmuramoyl-L-alanine amidase [Oscillospiraceae bacterium]